MKEMVVKCGLRDELKTDPRTYWTCFICIAYLKHVFQCVEINIFFIDNTFHGNTGASKLSYSDLSGFIAQLLRVLHRYRRGHGFEAR